MHSFKDAITIFKKHTGVLIFRILNKFGLPEFIGEIKSIKNTQDVVLILNKRFSIVKYKLMSFCQRRPKIQRSKIGLSLYPFDIE